MTQDVSPASTPVSEQPGDYRPLFKYLNGRFADSIVLTFGQIEDLLGRALPGPAFSEPAWWAGADAGQTASPQSSSWSQAHRTAKANLAARTVLFDRA
jgi:hypothetical protein